MLLDGLTPLVHLLLVSSAQAGHHNGDVKASTHKAFKTSPDSFAYWPKVDCAGIIFAPVDTQPLLHDSVWDGTDWTVQKPFSIPIGGNAQFAKQAMLTISFTPPSQQLKAKMLEATFVFTLGQDKTVQQCYRPIQPLGPKWKRIVAHGVKAQDKETAPVRPPVVHQPYNISPPYEGEIRHFHTTDDSFGLWFDFHCNGVVVPQEVTKAVAKTAHWDATLRHWIAQGTYTTTVTTRFRILFDAYSLAADAADIKLMRAAEFETGVHGTNEAGKTFAQLAKCTLDRPYVKMPGPG